MSSIQWPQKRRHRWDCMSSISQSWSIVYISERYLFEYSAHLFDTESRRGHAVKRWNYVAGCSWKCQWHFQLQRKLCQCSQIAIVFSSRHLIVGVRFSCDANHLRRYYMTDHAFILQWCQQDQILKTKTEITRPRSPEVNKGTWRI